MKVKHCHSLLLSTHVKQLLNLLQNEEKIEAKQPQQLQLSLKSRVGLRYENVSRHVSDLNICPRVKRPYSYKFRKHCSQLTLLDTIFFPKGMIACLLFLNKVNFAAS